MPISKDQSVLVRFGPYTADTKSGELRKHGVRIPLQVQPFQILQVFLEGGIRHSEGLGQRTDRMNISLEFDCLANRRFAVRGFTDWQHSFDGIGSLEDLTTPELALTHDRLLKASYWHLGGGVAFSVTPKTSINADVVTFLSGSVTHYGTGISVGITRSFELWPRAGH